jgi:DNA-binding PadR family transcriptional regulator
MLSDYDYQSALTRASETRARWALVRLGLTTNMGKWKIDLRILKKLLPSKANVYELKWKRLKDSNEHYSTVLRALRRLERKKLVRLVSSNEEGRRHKTYACTLLGELVVALARRGLEAASQIIAENSQSFRECLEVHPLRDCREDLTINTIKEILESKGGKAAACPDLDFYVRNAEFKWARQNIIEELNSISHARARILEYLREATHINWLSEWLALPLEKHADEEDKWLQTLRDLKKE